MQWPGVPELGLLPLSRCRGKGGGFPDLANEASLLTLRMVVAVAAEEVVALKRRTVLDAWVLLMRKEKTIDSLWSSGNVAQHCPSLGLKVRSLRNGFFTPSTPSLHAFPELSGDSNPVPA